MYLGYPDITQARSELESRAARTPGACGGVRAAGGGWSMAGRARAGSRRRLHRRSKPSRLPTPVQAPTYQMRILISKIANLFPHQNPLTRTDLLTTLVQIVALVVNIYLNVSDYFYVSSDTIVRAETSNSVLLLKNPGSLRLTWHIFESLYIPVQAFFLLTI